MALEVSVENDSGAVLTYVRVQKMETYYAEKCVDVTFYAYVSERARRDDKKPAHVRTKRFFFEDLGVAEDGDPKRDPVSSYVEAHLSEDWIFDQKED